MAKALIVYYSRSGNTAKMADVIEDSIKAHGLEVVKKKVEDTTPVELMDYDAIIVGSPTYYGTLAWPMKKLIDESVAHHGSLAGKVGAAFSSAANVGGGNETTVISMLEAFLIHGMVVQGDPRGDHYGPIAINDPDERAVSNCKRLGALVASLTLKLSGK